MTGNVTVYWARIHARAAADAAKHGTEFMSQNIGASVVHDYDMHIFWGQAQLRPLDGIPY